jgi:CheY-like chemotaxis protein
VVCSFLLQGCIFWFAVPYVPDTVSAAHAAMNLANSSKSMPTSRDYFASGSGSLFKHTSKESRVPTQTIGDVCVIGQNAVSPPSSRKLQDIDEDNDVLKLNAKSKSATGILADKESAGGVGGGVNSFSTLQVSCSDSNDDAHTVTFNSNCTSASMDKLPTPRCVPPEQTDSAVVTAVQATPSSSVIAALGSNSPTPGVGVLAFTDSMNSPDPSVSAKTVSLSAVTTYNTNVFAAGTAVQTAFAMNRVSPLAGGSQTLQAAGSSVSVPPAGSSAATALGAHSFNPTQVNTHRNSFSFSRQTSAGGATNTTTYPMNTQRSFSSDGVGSSCCLRVLIVDDSPSILKLSSMMLRRKGYDVETAENGALALTCLKRNGPFDVVLMDIQMPVMDGLEATRRIREAELVSEQSGNEDYDNSLGRLQGGKLPLILENALTTDNLNSLNSSNHSSATVNNCIVVPPLASTVTAASTNTVSDTHKVYAAGNTGSRRNSQRLIATLGNMSYEVMSNASDDNNNTFCTTYGNNMTTSSRQFSIGLSACSDNETITEAFEAGIDVFISKPFTMDSFKSAILHRFSSGEQ